MISNARVDDTVNKPSPLVTVIKRGFTVMVLLCGTLMMLLTYLMIANFRYVVFAIYPTNRDYMEASIKVKQDEARMLQEKTKEIHETSIKHILSPIVINLTDK